MRPVRGSAAVFKRVCTAEHRCRPAPQCLVPHALAQVARRTLAPRALAQVARRALAPHALALAPVRACTGAHPPWTALSSLTHTNTGRPPMQSPSSAASVVALQRLRQEMAAAWRPAGGTPACTADAPSAPAPPAASASCDADSGVWLSSDALGLALPCLKHGSEGGWHDEAGVLAAADVQAAALSLLRWVLLRERAAPRGLLPPPQAAALLRSDLLPLRACVEQLLQLQAAQMAGVASGGSTDDDGSSGVVERQRLDGFLAVQRLHEALGCVVDLLQQQAKPA